MPLTPNIWVKECDSCHKLKWVQIHELLDFTDDPRCMDCKAGITVGGEDDGDEREEA